MTDPAHILVTGGAGYLGAVLVPALLRDGHTVTVLDNFLFGQASLNACCADPRFEIVRGDARDVDTLKPLVAKADVVIPLAALVGAPICDADPIGAKTLNLDAQLALLQMLSADQRVLAPITNSGYGVGERDKFCTEETPMRPLSTYGRYKVEVENAMLARGNAISFRLATVFGMSPRMRIDLLVNDFTHRAVRDRAIVLFEAHFKRNFIHVRDVARAFQHGLARFDDMVDEAFNVGLSTANLSKAELCAVIQKQLPDFRYVEAAVGEDPDKRDYIVSNAKIEATGWSPNHSLDDGVRELIKGYAMLRANQYANV